jgi:threonine dehydrogenase-like Zn-dependent dehydrogenase
MKTSIAAVMQAPGRIGLQEFDVPSPGPGAAILKVHLSGICGTDKHTYRGESKQYAGTPHERDLEYPLICGHENVGTIVATGGELRDSEGNILRVGDKVVPGANVACGICYYCINNFPYYFCMSLEDYGNSLNISRSPSLLGGWSQYMYLLPGTPIFRVPDNLPDEVAVITEVMAVTHGVDTAIKILGMQGGASGGFSVGVLGVGPLGLCHLIKARLLGAGLVVASDVMPERLEFAKQFGLNLGLNAKSTSRAERIETVMSATNGRGLDLILNCSGVTSTFTEALKMVRVGGVIVEAGTFVDMGPVEINPNSDICTRSITILGIGGEKATEYLPSMKLMAANLDRYPLTKITSHIFPLDRAEEAVLMAQSGESMQVAINPTLPIRSR